MRHPRPCLILLCVLIGVASSIAPSWSASRPVPEAAPPAPLQQQLLSPDDDPREFRQNLMSKMPAEVAPAAGSEPEASREFTGYTKSPGLPSTFPLNWGDDVLVSSYDDVVRNAEFDFDVTDGTLYGYLWRDWGVYPEHRFYKSTNGGQSWDWCTGSTYEPLTFSDSDFIFCDSIAVAVCAFKHDIAHTINADRFNLKNLSWDPGHMIFYSTSASDSIYSLALATDWDNYLHTPFIYLTAHIGTAIHFWRSTDKGRTWGNHVILDQGNVRYPDIAYAWLSGGMLYVTYFKDGTVHLVRNTMFGSSSAWIAPWRQWSLSQTAGMSVVAAVRDTIQVVFEHYSATYDSDQIETRASRDGGMTWAGQLLTYNSSMHLYPDVTARGGRFRVAFFEFEGSNRRVVFRRCRNASILEWDLPVTVNDHFPYWDHKPFGNPCVEGMPGGWTGIMYTGFRENRKAWFDYEASVPSGLADDLAQVKGLHPFANPSRGPIALSFDMERDQDVVLDIYDIAGRRVAQILRGVMTAGTHSVIWNPGECAEGIYFVTLTMGNAKQSRKLVLLR